MSKKKFCPDCKKEKKKSCVYFCFASKTWIQKSSYWNEEGDLVEFPEKKYTESHYKCSNDHSWSERHNEK